MFMREHILKWRRDRAVSRLRQNSQHLVFRRRSLAAYRDQVPSESRDVTYILKQMAEIERLRQRIEDDKNFIRTTA